MNSKPQNHIYSRNALDPNANDSLAKIARIVTSGCTVLDIGCATGSLGQYLWREKHCLVDGIEVNTFAAAVARPHYRMLWEIDVESDQLEVALGGRFYDFVICADVLEHLRDPSRVLQRLSQCLLPSGSLIISIPNVGYMGVLMEIMSGDFRYRERGLLDETHLRFYTGKSFLRLLGTNGYRGQIVDRIAVNIQDSEFSGAMPNQLGPELLRHLESQQDATTYQFIIEAFPDTVAKDAFCRLPSYLGAKMPPLFACQIYWRGQNESFDETRSHRIYLPVGVDRTTIEFLLPTDAPYALRLDPADRRGMIRLYSIRVLQGATSLWVWDRTVKTLLSKAAKGIIPSAGVGQETYVELSFVDQDPWLEIPVPQDVLIKADKLEVMLSSPTQKDEENAQRQHQLPTYQENGTLAQNPAYPSSPISNYSALTQALHEARESGERLRAQIELLTNSRSWRLTVPLRALNKFCSRLRLALAATPQGKQARYDIAKLMYQNFRFMPSVKARLRPLVKRWLSVTSQGDYSAWIQRYDTLSRSDRNEIIMQITKWKEPPKISIVMPVYRPSLRFLEDAISSVRGQLYQNWELCIADDCSNDPSIVNRLKEHAEADTRIKLVIRTENGHISAASNSALSLANGEFVALMDHDDVLSEHALYMIALYIIENAGNVDVLYSDEDKLDHDGQRYDPYFKPDWNRYLLYSQNYIAHLGVYRRSILQEIGGFRVGFEGSQDYDLLLRVLDNTTDERIIHVPFVLYHWRQFSGNTTFSSENHRTSDESAYRALMESVTRNAERVSLRSMTTVSGSWDPIFEMRSAPGVSIIIPTRDKVHLLKECMEGLISKTQYPRFEVIIIDNNSTEAETLEYYNRIKSAALPFHLEILYDESDLKEAKTTTFYCAY